VRIRRQEGRRGGLNRGGRIEVGDGKEEKCIVRRAERQVYRR
jgi:hypothetical protein